MSKTPAEADSRSSRCSGSGCHRHRRRRFGGAFVLACRSVLSRFRSVFVEVPLDRQQRECSVCCFSRCKMPHETSERLRSSLYFSSSSNATLSLSRRHGPLKPILPFFLTRALPRCSHESPRKQLSAKPRATRRLNAVVGAFGGDIGSGPRVRVF